MRAPWIPHGSHLIPIFDLEHEVIVNDEYEMRPMASLDSTGHGIEFHPRALLGAAWDSNPLSLPDGSEGSLQTRLAAGLEARLLGQDDWSADLGGMLRREDYTRYPSRGFTGGEAMVRAQRAGATSLFSAMASTARDSEPVSSIPEIVRRASAAARVQYRSLGPASSWSLSAGGDRLDYLEATSAFAKDERDHQRVDATATWYALGAADSKIGIEGRGEALRRPADSTMNGYRAATLQGRWRHAIGTHSASDLRLGAGIRDFDDSSEDDPLHDDQRIIAAECSLSLAWGWQAGSWLSLMASTGLTDSVATGINAARRDALTWDVRRQLTVDSYLFASGWLSRRTNSAARVGEDTVVVDDQFMRLGIDQRLREGLVIRGWASWQHSTTSTGIGISRAQAVVEVGLVL